MATALARPCDTKLHELTAKQLMDALSSGKKPRGQPRTRWRNYAEDLAGSRLDTLPGSRLETLPEELPLVAKDRDVWRSQLELLPMQPQKDK